MRKQYHHTNLAKPRECAIVRRRKNPKAAFRGKHSKGKRPAEQRPKKRKKNGN
jgi:hypothetical protein